MRKKSAAIKGFIQWMLADGQKECRRACTMLRFPRKWWPWN